MPVSLISEQQLSSLSRLGSQMAMREHINIVRWIVASPFSLERVCMRTLDGTMTVGWHVARLTGYDGAHEKYESRPLLQATYRPYQTPEWAKRYDVPPAPAGSYRFTGATMDTPCEEITLHSEARFIDEYEGVEERLRIMHHAVSPMMMGGLFIPPLAVALDPALVQESPDDDTRSAMRGAQGILRRYVDTYYPKDWVEDAMKTVPQRPARIPYYNPKPTVVEEEMPDGVIKFPMRRP